jgi:hypothetical protein
MVRTLRAQPIRRTRSPEHTLVRDWHLSTFVVQHHHVRSWATANSYAVHSSTVVANALAEHSVCECGTWFLAPQFEADVVCKIGLYQAQGRYADAEPLFKRSLAIHEKELGRNHPYVANGLNSLASLQDQGRYADAEPLLKRVVTIDEESLGPDHDLGAHSGGPRHGRAAGGCWPTAAYTTTLISHLRKQH